MAEDNAFQLVGNPITRVPRSGLARGSAFLMLEANGPCPAWSQIPPGVRAAQPSSRMGEDLPPIAPRGLPDAADVQIGQLAETPQVQGQIKYTTEALGQAPYFGHPQPLTLELTAGGSAM